MNTAVSNSICLKRRDQGVAQRQQTVFSKILTFIWSFYSCKTRHSLIVLYVVEMCHVYRKSTCCCPLGLAIHHGCKLSLWPHESEVEMHSDLSRIVGLFKCSTWLLLLHNHMGPFWSHALRVRTHRMRCESEGRAQTHWRRRAYLTARLAKVTGVVEGVEGYKWDGGTRWSNRRVKWERWLHSFP